jgi:hypothetical protein
LRLAPAGEDARELVLRGGGNRITASFHLARQGEVSLALVGGDPLVVEAVVLERSSP